MLEGLATLQELETWYSLDDVADRNDALDLKLEAEKRAHEKAKGAR